MSTTHRLFDEEEREEFIEGLKEWPNTDWGTDEARHSVSPFISFYFPLGPDNHQEIALLMVDIHEAFEQLLGKPYTIGTHPISERPHPYGSSRLPDLREQARKASRSEHFVFKFTDEKNHASSPTTAGYFWRTWFIRDEERRTAYSSIMFYYRWQWWQDNREAWRRFVLKTIDLLKAHQVYSGFAMANPLQFGTRSAITTWERSLAPSFYGLDIDFPFGMQSELRNGIRPPPGPSFLPTTGAKNLTSPASRYARHSPTLASASPNYTAASGSNWANNPSCTPSSKACPNCPCS